MHTCPYCKTKIKNPSLRCPKCLAIQTRWITNRLFAGSTLVIVASIILAIFILFRPDMTALSNQTAKNQSLFGNLVDTVTSPAQQNRDVASLVDDYQTDPESAPQTWEGKTIEFTAPIDFITTTNLYFRNQGSHENSRIQVSCRTGNADLVSSLSVGQEVTAKGTVSGFSVSVIGLDSCQVSQQ